MAPVAILLEPKNAQSIYYQFTALVIAIGAYFYTRKKTDKLQSVGLIGWLLPKDILTHPSAMTDYGYFIVSQMLAASIYGSIIISSAAWEQGAAGLLTSVFGPAGVGVGSSHWITLICTLLLLIVIDAAVWWAHYMFHVVPFLWEFHKVHHSAEVMTPITALRMHPVEQLADALVVGLVTGVVIAIIR
ncbi:MAG TPA: sterol desaturase family protein, partial [Thermohalobaculum sp.]|nr:sterol desaturase family protein [Thermohalobaculum sp.]